MAGSKNGVKTQLLAEEPDALFTHCYGHALSLSVTDTVKNVALLKSTMDTTHDVLCVPPILILSVSFLCHHYIPLSIYTH